VYQAKPFLEERLMSQSNRSVGRLRPQARSLAESLRQFLTPAVWKQAQATRPCGQTNQKRSPRWQTQPLVLVLLFMTWCCGDSQAECFETARATCSACLLKRRRPGKTLHGFQKALAKLPLRVLRRVAAGVRGRLAGLLDLDDDGFRVFGCDGSLLECPRSEELERRLGDRGNQHSAPGVWVTALVHLRTGVLWAWRLGKSTAAERVHLLHLLPTLPDRALIVADAGFNGYWLAQAILQAQASFLIRISGKDTLYADTAVDRTQWDDGLVYVWPRTAQAKRQPPLRLRLICVRAKKTHKDVWLLTNVTDSQRLPAATAARYYRWRWENEGLFRTYKRTLQKVKLASRTLRLVHREAEGSLLATQVLLAQGAQAMPRRKLASGPRRCSPRQVLLTIRRALHKAVASRRHPGFAQQLAKARREQRSRTSAKEKRAWPRRKPHEAPKPPTLLTLSDEQKSLLVLL
jgi:hypothetical protein